MTTLSEAYTAYAQAKGAFNRETESIPYLHFASTFDAFIAGAAAMAEIAFAGQEAVLTEIRALREQWVARS